MERPQGVPVDKVKELRSKGTKDDQIVEALQKQGYLSSQIFDAMTQADMKSAAGNSEVEKSFPDKIPGAKDISEQHSYPSPPPPHPGGSGFSPPPQQSFSPPGNSTEELIESIIDEKWSDIEKSIQKVIDWKNDTEKRVSNIENDLKYLKEQFDKLHNSVVGKVGEYDKNIMNVGAEIKAMEKAFSKIIPDFADAVSEFSDLMKDFKKEK